MAATNWTIKRGCMSFRSTSNWIVMQKTGKPLYWICNIYNTFKAQAVFLPLEFKQVRDKKK